MIQILGYWYLGFQYNEAPWAPPLATQLAAWLSKVERENHRLSSCGPYRDYSLSLGSQYFLAVTIGVMIDRAGWHPYIGGGIMLPGPAGAVTSGYNVGHGWNVAGQGTLTLGGRVGGSGQRGYTFGGGWYHELGVGTPQGWGLVLFYVF